MSAPAETSPSQRRHRQGDRRDRGGYSRLQGGDQMGYVETRGESTKLLDVSKLARSGWISQIGFAEVLRSTVEWDRDHFGSIRQ